MSFKQQVDTLKRHWLILVVLLVVLFLFSAGSDIASFGGYDSYDSYDGGYPEASMARSIAPSYYPESDFAPEVEERKITKSASMSNEVKRGMFYEEVANLKNIVKSSDAILLNENINKRGTDKSTYYTGSFSLKVDNSKYEAVVTQLKSIGEVTSFNENTQDVTGRHVDLKTEIALEKERLQRYEGMYSEAILMEDKITLSDRIFNQESTIKYLEDQFKNLNTRIDYTTIDISLREKQSEYASVVFIKLSELVTGFVDSVSALIGWFVILLPWFIAFLILRYVYKKVK